MVLLIKYTLLCVVLGMITCVWTKDLHVKNEITDEKLQSFTNVMNFYEADNVFTKHERVARHVEAPRETVLSHVFQQMVGHTKALNKLVKKIKSKTRKEKQGKKKGSKSSKRRRVVKLNSMNTTGVAKRVTHTPFNARSDKLKPTRQNVVQTVPEVKITTMPAPKIIVPSTAK